MSRHATLPSPEIRHRGENRGPGLRLHDARSDPWMVAMRCGDFSAAWEISDRVLAHRRASGEDCSHWPRHLQFIWNGEPLDDQDVLVRCYHGLGDTLQYVRFLEPLRRRARSITLWAQPALLGILRHVRGIDLLLSLHDGVADVAYDVDIESTELPHALRITCADLPGRMPYVLVPETTEQMTLDPALLHVGIAWRSGPWNAGRSIPAAALKPLGSVAGTAFHSLQYPAEPLPFAASELACRDIERMAQRMRALDLVVCVDTMTAHLAGALGCRTWVLLTERPDWRWLEDRDDSPWYPTLRLFRRCAGGWRALIDRVAAMLDRDRNRFIAAHRIR